MAVFSASSNERYELIAVFTKPKIRTPPPNHAVGNGNRIRKGLKRIQGVVPPVTLDCAGSLRIDVGMTLQLEPRGRIRTKRMVDPPARMEHGHQPFCSFGLQAPNLTQLFNRMKPSQRIKSGEIKRYD